MCELLSLHYFPWNRHCPDKGLYLYSPLGAHSCHFIFIPWVCWPCWPIGFITSFFGLPRPTLLFSPYSSCGPVSCHSCHVGLLGLLPLFLGFLSRLTSSLPLILPMGLLAVTLVMLVHWACYLFSLASPVHLLLLYLLFFPWACWLLLLPCWPIGLAASFHGLPGSLTSPLPFNIPMSLLAVIFVMLTYWVY